MASITEQTARMVERIKTGEFADPDFGTLNSPCPKCGSKIHEGYKHFKCEKCDYKLWKVVAGREWSTEEMDELLSKRQIGPVQGFRSKMGRAFAALIKLDENHTPSFDFGNENDDSGEAVDFTGQEALGHCPKCNANVFEQPMAYVCEKSSGAAKTCDFRSGKTILQQEIPRAEMLKLLTEGKTSLLKGFVSNRTKRKFSAYLVRGKDGKVGFEFEERKAKSDSPKKVAAAKVGADGTASEDKPATKAVVKKVTKKPAKATVKKAAAKKPAAKPKT
jgi:DNA topoisomerase-3